ncbi:unnamed protein product [Notodromas monacha]|uniref:Uncharacterized protein n=1 Tax=Notodromas monacha TaxID=399045 RepID=A0A7R9GEA5_9CRUS|nr:unnamed protein product [Notodromas monacha]CAG0919419.1 unnamed protein product [Notodromas monacha]
MRVRKAFAVLVLVSGISELRDSGGWGSSTKSDDSGNDVTLVSFAARRQSTRRASKSIHDIAQTLPRKPSEDVTLVGFSRTSGSFRQRGGSEDDHYSPFCTNTLKTSKELKMERERVRQEKMAGFSAKDWVADDDLSDFMSASDRKFADRREAFNKFFTDNRDRFAEMKEQMRKRSEEAFASRVPDFGDLFDRVTADWNVDEDAGFRRSFSSSSGFDSSSEASSSSSRRVEPQLTGFRPAFTTSDGLTRFTPIIVSPPGNRLGYRVKTHRSTFEYCGSTNTYKQRASLRFAEGRRSLRKAWKRISLPPIETLCQIPSGLGLGLPPAMIA